MNSLDRTLENVQKEIELYGRSGSDGIYIDNLQFSIERDDFCIPTLAKQEEAVEPDLSHKDICRSLDEELNDIIKDPLLRDLPTNSTIEEIKSRVALEKGKAIIVNLKRQGETEEVTRKSSHKSGILWHVG